jgi:Ca2+-binding RTX toxin-like protein
LRAETGNPATSNESIEVMFLVAAAEGLFEETTSGPVLWAYTSDLYGDGTGVSGYIVTAVMAAGEHTLSIDVNPLGAANDVVGDHNASLSFELTGLYSALPLGALDGHILMNGTPVGAVALDVIDADSAFLKQYGIGDEAHGLGLVQMQMEHLYDGRDADHGQVIIGTDSDDTIYGGHGNDIIYGGGGDNILIGGGDEDTFVWNNASMGGTDTIGDFHMGDTLRFDDLFSGVHGHNAEHALEELLTKGLNNGASEWNGNTFHAEDGATSIHLSIDDTIATLTVSYEYDGRQLTQDVVLQGFNASEHLTGASTEDVAQMLQTIIKVGGNT